MAEEQAGLGIQRVTAAISSSLSVKSNTSMFCSISRCVDLGNATMFRCTSQRRIT